MLRKLTVIAAVLLWCGVTTTPAANIIVVTEQEDRNLDGVVDDQGLLDWLVAEGHSVETPPNPWAALDAERVAQLEAADLVIISRLTDSTLYVQDDETTQWNSLKTPLLLLNGHLARMNRWNWVNCTLTTDDTPDTYAEAMDCRHPIFCGVLPAASDVSDPNEFGNLVLVIDPNVGSGLTTFLGTTDVGNGRLIARTAGTGLGWIAEWDTGVEFYPGAGQFAGGKRLLFCAGTEDLADPNDDLQGEFNLASDGQTMLRNAIAYLLGGANIILVTEDSDRDMDGVRDDSNLEKFLVSAGHFVDARPGYWRQLDAGKIAELKGADLILFSRAAESGGYAGGDEASQWNSLAVPLLQMNAFCTAQGELDLTPASLQMLHNAIACLLPSGTGPQP